MKEMNEFKKFESLIELRKALLSNMDDDELKIAHEREAELGARLLLEEAKKMESVALLCILESFRSNNPSIIIQVAGFVSFIDGILNVFGEETTHEILKRLVPKMGEILIERDRAEEKECEKIIKKINNGEDEKPEINLSIFEELKRLGEEDD